MDQDCVKTNRKREWLSLLFCAIPSIGFFFILFIFAGEKSFFSDEMDQLGILVSVRNFKELLSLYASVQHEVAPPMFAASAWFWMKIVPFSQRSLQMLSILLSSFGIFFLGMAGKTFFRKEVHCTFLLPAVLCLFMPSVSLTAGMQFRQYGLLFFLSSLLIWLYFCRYRQFETSHKVSWGSMILYGAVMAGLPYTHYVSTLLPACLFLVDLVQVLRKKVSGSILISYFLGAALFLPWGLTIVRAVSARTEFWLDAPRILDIIQALFFLTDGNEPHIVFALLCLGMITTVLRFLGLAGDAADEDLLFPVLLSAVPFLMIGLVFIYSKLNPSVSLFLDRYFLVLIPLLAVIEAKGIADLIQVFIRHSSGSLTGAVPFLAASITLLLFALGLLSELDTIRSDAEAIYEPYHEAASLLNEQPDLDKETTAVFTSNLSRYVTRGWCSLYLNPEQERALNIFDYSNCEPDHTDYVAVYTFVEHAALPKNLADCLSTQYHLDSEFQGEYHVNRYLHN